MDQKALWQCDNSESWSISLLKTEKCGSGRSLAEVAGLQAQTSSIDPMSVYEPVLPPREITWWVAVQALVQHAYL